MTDDHKIYPHTEDHKAKGDWNPLWEQFRELDPDFLETIQLTTVMGIHSCNLVISILMEEVSKFKE